MKQMPLITTNNIIAVFHDYPVIKNGYPAKNNDYNYFNADTSSSAVT